MKVRNQESDVDAWSKTSGIRKEANGAKTPKLQRKKDMFRDSINARRKDVPSESE